MKRLDKRDIEDIFALTPMQEGMLFFYLKDPTSNYYFEQLSPEISGEIDKEPFEKAWNFVVETNEMLQTLFRWENLENPVQIILKKHQLQLIYHDLTREEESQKNSKDRRDKDCRQAFRLLVGSDRDDCHSIVIAYRDVVLIIKKGGLSLYEKRK
jgi:hypothetical protein